MNYKIEELRIQDSMDRYARDLTRRWTDGPANCFAIAMLLLCYGYAIAMLLA